MRIIPRIKKDVEDKAVALMKQRVSDAEICRKLPIHQKSVANLRKKHHLEQFSQEEIDTIYRRESIEYMFKFIGEEEEFFDDGKPYNAGWWFRECERRGFKGDQWDFYNFVFRIPAVQQILLNYKF